MLYQIFKKFKIDSVHLQKTKKKMKDKKRFGRPITATTDDNISKIQEFIKIYPYHIYN